MPRSRPTRRRPDPALALPRRVESTLLHRTFRGQLETFVEEAARTERPLPGFVERELRAFVDCGIAAKGFVRVHCSGCGHDRLVPFSCKRRGFCPSCGGRRMAEGAAQLVDRVLPRVPIRQWTLSLPFALRFRLAMNHRLTSRVLGLVMRAILGFQRSRARDQFAIPDGRCGAVIQRFGSALNTNLHFHAIVLDGVHVEEESGRVRFQVLPAPRRGELLLLVETIARRVHALLEREGLLDGENDDASDEEETRLTRSCQAASARGVTRVGERAGQALRRLMGETPERAKRPPDSCRAEGFDLHVGARIRGSDRTRMERLARYALRPPLATERLSELPDGRLKYELRHPWRDGTRAILFEPLELIERLVALIPAPRALRRGCSREMRSDWRGPRRPSCCRPPALGAERAEHLVRYHGTLAPGSKLRSRIVPARIEQEKPPSRRAHAACEPAETEEQAPHRLSWAKPMKRVCSAPSRGGREQRS